MTSAERVAAKDKERRRLAEALRENLKRRKALMRERAAKDDDAGTRSEDRR